MRIVFEVGKLIEYRQIFIDIFLVGVSACRVVDNGYNLCAGDVVVRSESSVRIAVEPADIFSKGNVFDRPMLAVNVGILCCIRRIAHLVKQTVISYRHRNKFGSCYGFIRTECVIRIALDDTILFKIGNVACVPFIF